MNRANKRKNTGPGPLFFCRLIPLFLLGTSACVQRYDITFPPCGFDNETIVAGAPAVLTFCADANGQTTDDVPKKVDLQIQDASGVSVEAHASATVGPRGDAVGCPATAAEESALVRVTLTLPDDGTYRVVLRVSGPGADYGVGRFYVATRPPDAPPPSCTEQRTAY
jgi:hypothetical protein